MEGRATACVLGVVTAPPEKTDDGYRLRVCVTERRYDSRTRTKTERSSWLWLDGRGSPPLLKKGDKVCAEAFVRSFHDEAGETMKLEIDRLVLIETERKSQRGSVRGI